MQNYKPVKIFLEHCKEFAAHNLATQFIEIGPYDFKEAEFKKNLFS